MTDLNFEPKTIWIGENLRIMRGINSNCVDMIYLDPPFNSNRDYEAPIGSAADGAKFEDTWTEKRRREGTKKDIKDTKFKDIWTLSDHDVFEHGELAERNEAAYNVIEAARTSHGKSMMSYLIFMAVRMLEMKRILKDDTGSICLHCDDTASHYLKILMDTIFGHKSFRGHIIWQRSTAKNDAKKAFGRISDHILHYAMPNASFKRQYVPLDRSYIENFYKYGDEKGPYRLGDLANTKPGNYKYDWKGYSHPPNGWRCPKETMQELHDKDLLNYPVNSDGSPAYEKRISRKRYLSESKGKPIGNIWTDFGAVQAKSTEYVGYPTQKPIALLNRIIEATSRKDDIVFDPFCGCATSMVSAEFLGRKWIGCDVSPVAGKLVNERIEKELGMFAPPAGGGGGFEKIGSESNSPIFASNSD